MTFDATARSLTIGFWIALVLSLPAWMIAGYPWPICILAALPLRPLCFYGSSERMLQDTWPSQLTKPC